MALSIERAFCRRRSDSFENRVSLQSRDTAAVAEGCIALFVDAADHAVVPPDIVERNPGRGKLRGGDPEGQTGYVGPCRSGLHAVFQQPHDAGLHVRFWRMLSKKSVFSIWPLFRGWLIGLRWAAFALIPFAVHASGTCRRSAAGGKAVDGDRFRYDQRERFK
jgi:hypothetical protein